MDVVQDPDAEAAPRRRVSLLSCPVCGNPLVSMDTHVLGEGFEYWESMERLWPTSLVLSFAIPHEIRRSLVEANTCRRAGAFLASVAMSGRALEAVCRHFKTKDQNLAEGLKELLASEVIDKRLYRWGDELRRYRNLAAHATDQIIQDFEAEQLLTFAVAICDYVFVLDHQFELFKQRKVAVVDILEALKASLRSRPE